MKKKCLHCKCEFDVKPSRFERTKFHSKECRLAYSKQHGMSQETKDKISATKGGVKKDKRICEECGIEFEVESWRENRFHSRQCAMRNVGRQPTNSWNTGLTKETDPTLARLAEKHSNFMKEKYETEDIWNKDLTKDTDPRVADYVAKQTTWRNTDSDAKNDWKKALSKGQVHAHAAGKYPRTFTIPEQLTWAHLESLGYTVKAYADKADDDSENMWYHQYPFEDTFTPDFACPDLRGIIEVNGCHHHGHDVVKCQHRTAKYKRAETEYVKNNIKRDRRKYSMYYRYGWKWALVWECEAHNNDFHRIEEYIK